MTSYLTQGTNQDERILNVINGMDCVSHNEIVPYCMEDEVKENEKPAIEHSLFERFFVPVIADNPDRMFTFYLLAVIIIIIIIYFQIWIIN